MNSRIGIFGKQKKPHTDFLIVISEQKGKAFLHIRSAKTGASDDGLSPSPSYVGRVHIIAVLVFYSECRSKSLLAAPIARFHQ
jgi:hypothetical protein